CDLDVRLVEAAAIAVGQLVPGGPGKPDLGAAERRADDGVARETEGQPVVRASRGRRRTVAVAPAGDVHVTPAVDVLSLLHREDTQLAVRDVPGQVLGVADVLRQVAAVGSSGIGRRREVDVDRYRRGDLAERYPGYEQAAELAGAGAPDTVGAQVEEARAD